VVFVHLITNFTGLSLSYFPSYRFFEEAQKSQQRELSGSLCL